MVIAGSYIVLGGKGGIMLEYKIKPIYIVVRHSQDYNTAYVEEVDNVCAFEHVEDAVKEVKRLNKIDAYGIKLQDDYTDVDSIEKDDYMYYTYQSLILNQRVKVV